ncbi:undecaprenyldiphospho-muramoylpentapeptide beta-N-acetylglucosaminyltransferase [Conexibacter stalactiti]|uniref:UDP-N-acetylglucosamine--N-acetylmuramyl-(pentapeptide) pyrophosphoryl-undecaprenol N-acetylglucosamine transferase n=1 Tax=Conexibacter stalactiti TaxID=1940611 RepID=A0ABU4HY05_9ACTN|nr:undecaprenyldiphospho-muramoylpentapeptide beta-N-acetylglucosaminyltransferase [Conexibacter stalactiti]MDW5598210.1 undecaprenyldiphospho-muramoylpentapeptide beta-N-acetylglucosaminyltransferase [Conexibacter stalactiti]MEC5038852.1 undecaprenyldiphospho-muramoylpentapeptide beta-N-acetylglucosaminyltransferase [Conexibacter stalactiti]
MSAPIRIVIAAGGTAGHVVPALAVADALRADGAEVVFVGGERAERELVPAAGYELRTLAVEGISRTNPLKAARAVGKAAAGGVKARGLLKELKPDAVMGGGGYVAGTVGAAAASLRLPLVLTEADSHLGISNRALARFARRVCLAFPLEGRDDERYLVTGRPVPPPATDRAAARARFGLGEEETAVVVFGGSLGARSINTAALEAFAAPDPHGRPLRIVHAAGARDFDSLRSPGEHYDLRRYIDGFGEALLAADLVVARSGGSIFEVAAAGRAAILVPYPHAAADHQSANARWMEQAGAAVVVPDSELTAERLAAEVGALLGDPARLASMAAASAALARPDAAQAIASELLTAAGQAR